MAPRQIDTLTLSPDNRLTAWEAHSQSELFAASCTPLDGRAFWGAQRNEDLGQIGVAEVRTSAHVLGHSPDPNMPEGMDGNVLVSILLEGEAVLGQGGQWLRHEAGDAILALSALPFTYVSTRPSHALVLRIPQSLFQLIQGAPLDAPMAIRNQAGARMFDQNALIRELKSWIAEGRMQDALGVQARVLSLLHALLRSENGHGVGRAHYLAALSYIVDHLCDGSLSPAAIARALNLSSRQLHRIFSQQGTSVMAEVSERRLQSAMLMLRDPGLASVSIAEAGYRCGFSSPAVFSRLYRKRFGLSPQASRRSFAKAGW